MRRLWKNLKLRSKLVVSMALISTLMTGAALLVVQSAVRRHIRRDLHDELYNSVTTFLDFQRRSEALSARAATLLANLPSLKALMTTDDVATIQDASAEISQIGKGGLFVLADRTGRVVGLHPATGGLDRATAQHLFHDTLQRNASRTWWYGNGQLYEVFLHPILIGRPEDHNLIGVLAYGQQIDQSIANQIGNVAAGEVVFADHGKPVVSTLPAQQLRWLERTHPTANSSMTVAEVTLGSERFAAITVQLDRTVPGLTLTVLKSYDKAMSFLQGMNRLIIAVGVTALVLGLLLVFLISRAFLRPLSTLVIGAQALEAGNYDFPLPHDSKDEAGQLTTAFNRMRTTLRQTQQGMVRAARMEALGQLASGVAHDFNNIITVINGFSDLLLYRLPPEDGNRRYASEIRNAGSRAVGLTRQLLLFSRQQAGHTQPVDLNHTIANMEKMLRMLVGAGIALEVSPGADLARIEIDPTHVEQIIMNLAANARDAMPGGGKLTIATSNIILDEAFTGPTQTLSPGPHVLLSVRDDGIGIAPETQSRIFEPFFTTKEVGKGTGLGLATVFSITRQHRGHIALTSAPGAGAAFDLYFPALDADRVLPVPRESSTGIRQGSETLLLVEPDDALRSLAQETLEGCGYTVLPAGDGVEAMEQILAHPMRIDMVVTNVVMLRMGGHELVTELRRRNASMRVLFLSGNTHTEEGILKEDGDVSVLEKPFTPADLLLKVHEALHAESSGVRSSKS